MIFRHDVIFDNSRNKNLLNLKGLTPDFNELDFISDLLDKYYLSPIRSGEIKLNSIRISEEHLDLLIKKDFNVPFLVFMRAFDFFCKTQPVNQINDFDIVFKSNHSFDFDFLNKSIKPFPKEIYYYNFLSNVFYRKGFCWLSNQFNLRLKEIKFDNRLDYVSRLLGMNIDDLTKTINMFPDVTLFKVCKLASFLRVPVVSKYQVLFSFNESIYSHCHIPLYQLDRINSFYKEEEYFK